MNFLQKLAFSPDNYIIADGGPKRSAGGESIYIDNTSAKSLLSQWTGESDSKPIEGSFRRESLKSESKKGLFILISNSKDKDAKLVILDKVEFGGNEPTLDRFNMYTEEHKQNMLLQANLQGKLFIKNNTNSISNES